MSVLARKEQATPASTSPICFLIATIGGRYLAFEAERIPAVLTKTEVGFLQDPVVQGVTYRVIDLAERLQQPKGELWDGTEVVLLADGTRQGSVRVQKAHGILEVQRSQVLPLPAQFCGVERRWYRGMILFDRSVALIVNTGWVLEERIDEAESIGASPGTQSIVVLQNAIQSHP